MGDSAGETDSPPTGRQRRHMPLWQELPLLLIIAFCLAVLIRTFLLQAFYIPSGSMEYTLLVGDRVLVNKVVYDTRQPRRGEVVVFEGTDNWNPEAGIQAPDQGMLSRAGRTFGDLVGVGQPSEKDFIKRVIGLPGDVVACCDDKGRVTVNGHGLDESAYVTEDSPIDAPPAAGECRARRFEAVTVEPGHLFVMGDHRLVSQDSRCQGQVPIDKIIGRAFAVVWPYSNWRKLPVPETFQEVPQVVGAPAPTVPGPRTRPGSPPQPLWAVVLAGPVVALLTRSPATSGIPAGSGLTHRRRRRKLRW